MTGRGLTDIDMERTTSLMRVYARAATVFASKSKAERWLGGALPELGGRTPLEVGQSEPGARLIEHILTRIAFGEAP